jgi:hypothetical protein
MAGVHVAAGAQASAWATQIGDVGAATAVWCRDSEAFGNRWLLRWRNAARWPAGCPLVDPSRAAERVSRRSSQTRNTSMAAGAVWSCERD